MPSLLQSRPLYSTYRFKRFRRQGSNRIRKLPNNAGARLLHYGIRRASRSSLDGGWRDGGGESGTVGLTLLCIPQSEFRSNAGSTGTGSSLSFSSRAAGDLSANGHISLSLSYCYHVGRS